MKKQKIFNAAVLFFLINLFLAFIVSCSDSAQETDETIENLFTGTWVKIWEDETYEYTPSGEETTDALIFDIGESDFRAVFYLYSEQVGGFKGSYIIEGDEIVVTAQYRWNNDEDFWEVPEVIPQYPYPFVLDGNTLTVIGYDLDQTPIELTKTVFGNPSSMSIVWTGVEEEVNDGDSLALSNDGSFSYEYGGDGPLEGTWDCSDYLLRFFSIIDEETAESYLLDYELYSGTELYIDGGEWYIYGEYAVTHTLTISMEDSFGGVDDGVTVYIELGIGEGSDYAGSAVFSGGTAEVFFPAVEEKEYLINAFIDENGDEIMGINEYHYNSDWITVDEDTSVTIYENDWYLPPQ